MADLHYLGSNTDDICVVMKDVLGEDTWLLSHQHIVN